MSDDIEWVVLHDPPVGCKIEVWTRRPDMSWMQTIGTMALDPEGTGTIMPFDAIDHMQFHDDPPDPVALWSGRIWRPV